jgi:uncharacterized membrane protein (UPF0127 family)
MAIKIINKTKDTILAENAVLADTFFKRIKGLIGRKEFTKGEALILEPCNSIHTFFMRFPIDVLFVDKDNRIIKAIISLKPFRLTPIYFKANLVVELPYGTISSTFTEPFDLLSFKTVSLSE